MRGPRDAAGRRRALDLEEEVFVIPIALSPPQRGPDVAIDRCDFAGGYIVNRTLFPWTPR